MPRGATMTVTGTTPPMTDSASEQVGNSSKLVSSSQKVGPCFLEQSRPAPPSLDLSRTGRDADSSWRCKSKLQRCAGRSGDLLAPPPPAEKATASQDQA